MFENKKFFLAKKNQLIFILFSFFPIFLILGNFFVNFFYISIFIISIFDLKNDKSFFKSIIFYLLLIFFCYLIVNLYFSINVENSFLRVIKFILIIFFINETQKFIIQDKLLISKIINFWLIIFLIVSFDIIFEYIFGFNTLGIKSPLLGRISSFFGDELVVGAFYNFLALLIISNLLQKKFTNFTIIILASIIIFISFIIGERANFIRLFLSILIFLNFTLSIGFFKKITLFSLVLLSIFFVILSNNDLKYRYYDQLKPMYSINGVSKYFKQSAYGAHQETAFQIFKKNIFFGIGIKNFRIESKKAIYENKEYVMTDQRGSTHPHQLHLELLSETGLIGYLLFLILIFYATYTSIKNYFKFRKNYFQLATILFLFVNIIPLIPTGSIFSTFYGGIFWFNFGLMIGLNYYSDSKF